MRYLLIALLVSCSQLPKENNMNENYLYLEEIQSDQALSFAKQHSTITTKSFSSDKRFEPMKKGVLEILNTPEKIPFGSIQGDYFYNFWRDKKNIRGIWRRMPLSQYLKKSKNWEVLIDLDELSKKEKKNWVWKGTDHEQGNHRLVSISLSNGGKDAHFKREFDLDKKTFVEDGFAINQEGKNSFIWINENEAYVMVDLGPETLTNAGYPRHIRHWKRGQKIEDTKIIYTVPKEYSYAWPWYNPKTDQTIIVEVPEWYKNRYISYNRKTNHIKKLLLPEGMEIESFLNDFFLITIRREWKAGEEVYQPGDLVSVDAKKLLNDIIRSKLVFRPNRNQSVNAVDTTDDKAYVSLLDDVRPELHQIEIINGIAKMSRVELPDELNTNYLFSNSNFRSDFFLVQSSFLKPETLYYFDGKKFSEVFRQKSYFDESQFQMEQFFTTSKDGERVPYFQVSKKGLKLDGTNPTVIYGYGGFRHSQLPYYSKSLGKYWLEQGGVYVLSNIRGGAEYGVRWHKSSLKEKRQNSYNDLYAIAEDLISRKVTSPNHLGVKGGSNGGLLTTVALTQRPDLFNGVISQVPLTDMERFHKLLAGHSWVGEYGDPEKKEELDFLLKYSPFHNLKKKRDYPTPFVWTSTLDDRVHPGHARKFVAKMKDLGHEVYYYENTEGGHAGASNFEQRARIIALEYIYLYQRLGI